MEWLRYHKVSEFYSQMSHTVDMFTFILVSYWTQAYFSEICVIMCINERED